MPDLNSELLKRLQTDDDLVFAIAKGTNRKFDTVRKWAFKKNEMLTSEAVILLIKQKTGLTDKQIFKQQKVA